MSADGHLYIVRAWKDSPNPNRLILDVDRDADGSGRAKIAIVQIVNQGSGAFSNFTHEPLKITPTWSRLGLRAWRGPGV